jgi:hypothetical protein
LLTYAQRPTAASVAVTYNDKGGGEKRESYSHEVIRAIVNHLQEMSTVAAVTVNTILKAPTTEDNIDNE